jgi:ornithine cyclodeaminase/alanine dehydrogenase-like protein (mu-crystallin family)
MTLVLSDDDVEEVLTMPDALRAMEIAFKDFSDRKAVNRPRSHTYTPLEGEGKFYCFKSMDGAVHRLGMHALRLTSDILMDTVVRGGKRFEKLPLGPGKKRLGLVLLFSIHTAELLTIMQDDYLQRMRVGATSGLAAQCLARSDAQTAGMFGVGWQAGAQVMALCAVRKIKSIKVFSPTVENRLKFAKEWSEKLGVEVRTADQPREVVRGVDIVVAATNSLEPVFRGDWLEEGQHVNSLQDAEIDRKTLERAAIVAVRSREQSTFWAMDERIPSQMAAHQTYDKSIEPKLRELGAIVTGKVSGRTDGKQITLFGGSGTGPSSGLGIQFAAIGAAIYEAAKKQGLGREIPTDWFISKAPE